MFALQLSRDSRRAREESANTRREDALELTVVVSLILVVGCLSIDSGFISGLGLRVCVSIFGRKARVGAGSFGVGREDKSGRSGRFFWGGKRAIIWCGLTNV